MAYLSFHCFNSKSQHLLLLICRTSTMGLRRKGMIIQAATDKLESGISTLDETAQKT